MKRLLLLFCAVVLTAVSLCSCMQQAGRDVQEGVETLASEARENLDNMIDNGTVNDNDGYVAEDEYRNDNVTPSETFVDGIDYYVDDATDGNNGLLNDNDVTEAENEFI